MNKNRITYKNLNDYLMNADICDLQTQLHVKNHIIDQKKCDLDKWQRRPGQMFWPPRIVKAVRDDSLIAFFGSGISLASGIPDWLELLRQMGLDKDAERDPLASGDMLTLAELVAHSVGFDSLQTKLRQAISVKKDKPTTAHFRLSALYLPIYLTTNYDSLFEDAFEALHKKKPKVITNDLNVKSYFGDDITSWDDRLKNNINESFLIKIHGSADLNGEQLILTRSDYRRHYRSNTLMRDFVKYIMETRHTLFLGFSHRDPEIARIIEDVIFNAENQKKTIPGFYSLQFDMLQKTPEIFAVRGIVALQPPLVLTTSSDKEVKSFALSQGLTDLFDNADLKMDEVLSLDKALRDVVDAISIEIEELLKKFDPNIIDEARNAAKDVDEIKAKSIVEKLLMLGEFANQGVYLSDEQGRVIGAACPPDLDADERRKYLQRLLDRPYFRLAKSNRVAFVSDVFESMFNYNASLAVCIPLHDSQKFHGILFSVFQLNDSGFAKRIRSLVINEPALLIIDSNGVLVIPPENEISIREPDDLCISTEKKSANIGYNYWELIQLSRRNKCIDRLVQNVVPLSQDDDVYTISPDAIAYSVVTELKNARWKVALTRFLRKQEDKEEK